MYRLAHEVSGGLIVTLPGPNEDHNPETRQSLSNVLGGRSDIPYDKRASVARFIEALTASDAGGWMSVISLHGGGSPQAMKGEIARRYPIEERKLLVERLMDRGLINEAPAASAEPGQCCDTGCIEPTQSSSEKG